MCIVLTNTLDDIDVYCFFGQGRNYAIRFFVCLDWWWNVVTEGMIGVVHHRHEELLLSGFEPCVNVLRIAGCKSRFHEVVDDPIYPGPITSISQTSPGKSSIEDRTYC